MSKGGKKERKGKGKVDSNNKYAVISFNYSSMPMTNLDRKSFINVPLGKLPHFDGTNFAKWKNLMEAYLIGLHPGIWEVVCNGFEPPVDPKNPTLEEMRIIHLSGRATNVLLSALDGDEYNRVIGVDVTKQIWDTLHLTHEGVDKVRKGRIDLLMAKLNRFVILDGDECKRCLIG